MMLWPLAGNAFGTSRALGIQNCSSGHSEAGILVDNFRDSSEIARHGADILIINTSECIAFGRECRDALVGDLVAVGQVDTAKSGALGRD